MIGNIGGFIGPIISGKIMDITGVQWPGFLFMGAALIIEAFFIFPVRETGQGRKKKD
jgi:MFS family permease